MDCDILLDEETAVNESIIEDIVPYLNRLKVHNDKISLIFHDYPTYMTDLNKKIRAENTLDDYVSFKNILLSNNYPIDKETIPTKNNTEFNQDSVYDALSDEKIIYENSFNDSKIKNYLRPIIRENTARLNSYKKNIYESYYLPEFLLYKSLNNFSKVQFDKEQYSIDEKGINFYFDISESDSNKLFLYFDQSELKLTFYNQHELVSEETIDNSLSAENYIVKKIPTSADFLHLKILSFNTIYFIGFIESIYEYTCFNQSIYDHLYFSFEEKNYNTIIIANTFNILKEDIIDNRVPIILYSSIVYADEHTNDHIYGLLNDFDEVQQSDDNEYVGVIHPKLVGRIANDEKLYLYIMKSNSNQIKNIKLNDYCEINYVNINRTSLIGTEDNTNDILTYFMSNVINLINEENYKYYDFLIELDYQDSIIKFIFESSIFDLVCISLYKFDDKYTKYYTYTELDDESKILKQNNYTSSKFLQFNLTRLKQILPIQIYRFDQLNLWFVKGSQNIVLNDQYEFISNTKDPVRSMLILNQFIKYFQNEKIETFVTILKNTTMQECIGSLYVNYNECLIWIDENLGIKSSNYQSSARGSTSSKMTTANTVKMMKYYYFSDSEKYSYVRLIGFMFLYFLRYVNNDFKFNKERLRIYFQSTVKYYTPFNMVYKNISNPSISRMINELPIFYLWTLYKYSVEFMDRKIDWIFSAKFLDNDGYPQDFMVYVSMEKGIALVNSPHSYLFPLPAILYFKDYLVDLTREERLNPTDSVKEGVEQYLKAFINEETLELVNYYLVPKYRNDIIQNTYFKLFDYSYEIKFAITNFIRETPITNSYTFSLLTYRIYNISENLKIKNDLMLIRYTDYMDNFEVKKYFYESSKDDSLKFHGLYFKEDDYNQYRVNNKEYIESSSILTVYMKVSNRVINIEEYLLGIYNNYTETIIYEFEIVRDIIDYITQKYLIIPYSIYVYCYLFTILLYLPMVYNYLLIVDPQKLDELNLTGWIVTSATILLIVEIFFLTKVVLEILFINILTNYSEGINYYITLFDIIITKTIFSEKIISIANNGGLVYTSFIIYHNITNNLLLDEFSMRIMLISCFICIFNLINFMSYFSFTQKLVITLIEIFKDLRWTMFVAFTLILCLTCTIWGIENLKHYLVDQQLLKDLTTSMAGYKSWISPYQLKTYSYGETLYYSISLALMGDTFIFSEYYYLISLLQEDEVNENEVLKNGIEVIKNLEIIWQAIVIIVIVAYIVVLLNFVIAIMSDTYGKVNDNFLMYTYRLKASYLIEWHWLLYLYIHYGMSVEQRYYQPWKVCLLNPDIDGLEEDWSGQIQVIKRYVGDQIKRVEGRVEGLTKISSHTERKVDEFLVLMAALKEDIRSMVKDELATAKEQERSRERDDLKTVMNEVMRDFILLNK